MPVKRGKDKQGCFFRFGRHGKKYYFNPKNKISIGVQLARAKLQGRAIKARGR